MTVLLCTDSKYGEDERDLLSGVKDIVEDIGPTNIDMIIEGETGVGKDTLARKIHEMSYREGAFVAVNCAAIPETLMESEFFGVVSGAYTGEQKSRSGYIEASQNGTLYLDEIDSMPLTLQAKLLRVLESRGVERLGSTCFVPVDMRVIASTKVPLEILVEKKRFRRDLYYRLNVVKIQLPSLRSNPDLIVPLFKRFVGEANRKFSRQLSGFDDEIYLNLLIHDWPGNARELKAAAERFVLGMPPVTGSGNENNENEDKWTLKKRLEKVEKLWIENALVRHKGRMDNVVSELCMPKRTLYYKMKKLKISH